MADIVGGGTGNLGSVSGNDTFGRVFRVDIELDYPLDGAKYPSTLMMVAFFRDSSMHPFDGEYDSVQIQVATDEDFTDIIFDNVLNDVTGDGTTRRTVNITALTNLETYWWRVRPVYPGTQPQPPWSFYQAWSATIDISSGDGSEYGDYNVGVLVTQKSTIWEYVDANLGIWELLYQGDWVYVWVNAGIEKALKDLGAEYAHEGDASTNMPDPHIWFLRPTAGRPFDGIDIIGFGFGDLQETHNGVPQIEIDGVWIPLAVTDWTAFPPTPAAYTAGRIIDETWDGYIDPQHQIISIIIPGGAKPPGHPVRVKTEE